MDATSVTPTAHQLRALTHPVRLRMLGYLRLDGPATATTLALRLGLNTGATSYHLRQLAQHGFVVDDEERGTGRERWWKAAHQSTRTRASGPDEDGEHGLDAYLQTVAVVYTEWLQQAMEERPLLPPEWRDASTFSDWVHRLTPRRAKAVIEAIESINADVEDEDEDEDALQFVVQVNAYVRPGQATQDPS